MDFGQSLEATRRQHGEDKQRELLAEEGCNCSLVLQLPDGTQHPHTFKMGTTVAWVKLQVEQNYSIPMASQKLTTSGGKVLIDPLSLSDCPGITPDASSLVLISDLTQQPVA